jgi:hypothetical protein
LIRTELSDGAITIRAYAPDFELALADAPWRVTAGQPGLCRENNQQSPAHSARIELLLCFRRGRRRQGLRHAEGELFRGHHIRQTLQVRLIAA